MGTAYARAGRRDEALRILDQLKALATSGDSVPGGYEFNLAGLYGFVGEKDQAFALLERAYQGHEWAMTNLRVNQFFDPLRSDPRFQELLKRVGPP
jgi:Flp pilus assembly protein TadD